MRLNGGFATAAAILAGVFILFDADHGIVHFNGGTLIWLRLNGIFLVSCVAVALVASGMADLLASEWDGAFYSHFLVPIFVFAGSVYALMRFFYGPAGPSDIIVWISLGLLACWLIWAISVLTNDDGRF